MQTITVNALNKNHLPLLVGGYSKSTQRSTQRQHDVNEGESGFEAVGVLALGALCSLKSKMKLVAKK
jgi:hypothetical protein